MRKALALLLLLSAALTVSAAEMSYILKRGDRSYIVTGHIDVRNIGSLTKRWSGDYLWAKIDGREYLIRDNATMSTAWNAFVHVEANQVEYDAIAAKMRPVEKRHEALEEALDKLNDRLGDDEELTAGEIRVMETRIRELETQMKPIEDQLRELERQEERVDEKQEKLEAVAEAKLEEIIRRAIARGVAERVP